MKNKPDKITFKTYFEILECCIFNKPVTRAQIAKYAKLGEYAIAINQLIDSDLIKTFGNDNLFQITSAGMSVYLSLQAQIKSANQARKATYFAIISILIAVIALIINIISISKKAT